MFFLLETPAQDLGLFHACAHGRDRFVGACRGRRLRQAGSDKEHGKPPAHHVAFPSRSSSALGEAKHISPVAMSTATWMLVARVSTSPVSASRTW